MKTKEEILKEATKRTLNINEGSPLHDAVLKAMEEYAQQQVKLFCQPAVVGQSEQLVCDKCKMPYTKEELQVGHCFNCGEMD